MQPLHVVQKALHNLASVYHFRLTLNTLVLIHQPCGSLGPLNASVYSEDHGLYTGYFCGLKCPFLRFHLAQFNIYVRAPLLPFFLIITYFSCIHISYYDL